LFSSSAAKSHKPILSCRTLHLILSMLFEDLFALFVTHQFDCDKFDILRHHSKNSFEDLMFQDEEPFFKKIINLNVNVDS
jgi:hypothetical protein